MKTLRTIIILVLFGTAVTLQAQTKRLSVMMGVSSTESFEDFDASITYYNPSVTLGYSLINENGFGYSVDFQYHFSDGATSSDEYDVEVNRTVIAIYGRYDYVLGESGFYVYAKAGPAYNMDLVRDLSGGESIGNYGAFGLSFVGGVGKSFGKFSMDLSSTGHVIFGKARIFPVRLSFNYDL